MRAGVVGVAATGAGAGVGSGGAVAVYAGVGAMAGGAFTAAITGSTGSGASERRNMNG